MSTNPRLVAMVAAFCIGWAVPVASHPKESTGERRDLNAGAAPAACEVARQKCFVGDRLCMVDAFDLAKDLLASNHWDALPDNDLLLVATGTIEDVHGLPDSLDVEREVQATFAIDWLHRYQTDHDVPDWVSVFQKSVARAGQTYYFGDGSARARDFGVGEFQLEKHPLGPMRFVDEWVRGTPKRIVIHLSSDMFLWPASGKARGMARMGSEERQRHESAKRRADALAAKLEAGELEREEHRLLLESTSDGAVSGGRFIEDRGGALEVGGRYLFALGERAEHDREAYRFTENARTKWRVFWGDELEEVNRAMRIGDCLKALDTLGESPREPSVWRICEDTARYSGAQYEPAVLRQRTFGQAAPCDTDARQKCFVGDRVCVDDAFDLAKNTLHPNHWISPRTHEVLLVATGTIEDVHGLPDSPLVEHEVRATFAIDELYRYQTEPIVPDWKYFFDRSFARASEAQSDGDTPWTFGAREYDLDEAHPYRPTRFVGEWVRGRLGIGPRKRITLHLSSDMFIWPGSGTARGVARMGSAERERHERNTRSTDALVARLEAGELDREEHRRLLRENYEHPLDGGRFAEDRGGALEVGGRYLFALGERVDGTQDAYRFTESAHHQAKWRVFWGGEMEDVVRALKELADCLATFSTLPLTGEGYEYTAWGICEKATRYRGARDGSVLRQRPIGQASKRSPLEGH